MSDLVRILLVEDNPPDARLFRGQLREVPGLEFELAHVSRLSEALDWLGANAADIAFVDPPDFGR